jgi:hypothetical protein
MHIGDGRSFIRNAKENFDVVQMTLVDTWASTAAGAFALSENSLYTADAFGEYFEHLKPDGIIAVTRWEFREPREALRVVSVAMAALQQLGVRDASHHFLVVSEGELDEDGVPVAVLVKKAPFTPEEESLVLQHSSGHEPLALLYTPSHAGPNAFTSLIQSNDSIGFTRGYGYNIAPVTDNSPFFFFTLKPRQILASLSDSGAMDWKVNLGVAVLGMVLVISAFAVLAFLIVPLLVGRERGTPASSLLYFIAIGLGYILTEITLIQRFVLFLGHPTYALTVVVFLLLLSSASGSVLSRKWTRDGRGLWLLLLAIIAVLVIYVAVLPAVLNVWVGAAFLVKLLLSGLLLAPLGFVMGMPFPTGLRALSGECVEWAWAMNAASSVLGSVLAIIIAIQLGLNVTLACAATSYGLALLLRGKLHRMHSTR